MDFAKVVTVAPVAPNDRPVTVELARQQCSVPDESQDTLIGLLIDAATNYVETSGRLILCPQTIRVEFERFPRGNAYLSLPYGPVRNSVTLTYLDTDGNWTTLSTKQEWTTGIYPKLAPAYTENWPETRPLSVPAVKATYECGFATASAIPASLQNAILMLVRINYENPDGWNRTGEIKVPLVVNQLIGAESRRSYP